MRRWLTIAIAAALGLVAGALLERALILDSDPSLAMPTSGASLPRLKNRQWSRHEAQPHSDAVACPEQATIVVVGGQSNAANSVGQRSQSIGNVFWSYQGRCYPAIDPMPGSEGSLGSIWPEVGDEMVRSGISSSVVFVGAAMGGTSIAQWADGSGLGGYLHERLVRLAKIDYVLWHQGEFDRSMSTAQYARSLDEVLHAIRAATTAPIFVAQASVCGGGGPAADIRAAQLSRIDHANAIFAGPDTDRFVAFADRYDDCHFSRQGALKVSHAWVESLATARAGR